MTDGKAQTVLQRKAEAGRPRPDQFVMSAPKALRQALAKAAQDLMDMPLRVDELTETHMSLAELPEALEDRALLALLDGPKETLGLMVISPVLLAGLIEMQTLGRLGATEVASRRPTRTDAAMCADFIDTGLEEFEEFLTEMDDITWAGGYRYASCLEDPRPLPLILEETNYRVFRADIDLGTSGKRRGQLLFAVPAVGRGPGPRKPTPADPVSEDAEGPDQAGTSAYDWEERIEQTVMTAPVQLSAVLHRISMPIADVMALEPGAVLPVPAEMLERLQLEGVDGRQLSSGRLGQTQGYRAVRLSVGMEGEDDRPAQTAPALGEAALSGAPPFPEPEDQPEPMSDLPQMDMSIAADDDLPDLSLPDTAEPLGMGDLPPLPEAKDDAPLAPLKMGAAI